MYLLQKLSEIFVIPVVKLDRASDALDLAKALCEGGLPVAEVTFRTDCAAEAIKSMKENFPDMILGAGTVLNTEQVDAAIEAGAEFIVTPGFNRKVTEYCVGKNIPILPGCVTPSEIEMALEFGLTQLKFFPAAQFGGLKTINALCAPYTMVKFMPTGGVTLENLPEFASNKNVFACGGTFMVTADLINNKKFDEITDICKKASEIVLNAKGTK